MPLRDRDLDLPLPLLPETAAAVARFFAREHSQHGDLQAIGLRDPGLAITLYRLLGELRPAAAADVSDLAHALSLIGRDALRQHLAGQPVLPPSAPSVTALRLHYSQAAHAACFARTLGELRGLPRFEQSASVAQLAMSALLVLAAREPESALRAANAVRDGVSWTTAYGAELQTDPSELNAAIAERWSLPHSVSRAARGQTHGAPGLTLARLAADLGLHALLGWEESGTAAAVNTLSEVMNREPDQVCSLVHQAAASAGRHLASMDYPLGAFDLILLDRKVELDSVEQTKLERVLRRMAQAPSDSPSKDPASDLQAAVLNALEGILAIEGLERSALFLLSEDRRRLKARLSAGASINDSIRGLDLPLGNRHLFDRLLSKPQSLWFNPDSAAKFRNLLPEAIAPLIKDREFFAMSLIADKRPLGILFADGQSLNETGYRRFRRLCQGVAETLGNRRKAA